MLTADSFLATGVTEVKRMLTSLIQKLNADR